MVSLPPDDVHVIAEQLGLLSLMLFLVLICKGGAFVASVLSRRDPPAKSIRSKLARSDES